MPGVFKNKEGECLSAMQKSRPARENEKGYVVIMRSHVSI
jgi:hypothetical protein